MHNLSFCLPRREPAQSIWIHDLGNSLLFVNRKCWFDLTAILWSWHVVGSLGSYSYTTNLKFGYGASTFRSRSSGTCFYFESKKMLGKRIRDTRRLPHISIRCNVTLSWYLYHGSLNMSSKKFFILAAVFDSGGQRKSCFRRAWWKGNSVERS